MYNSKTKKKETRTSFISNAEKRDGFIKKFGRKEYEKICKIDSSYADLEDIPFPKGYTWLFNHFYKIWTNCEIDFVGNKIFRARDIMDYCECFGVDMTYRERKLILLMKNWALTSIAELEREDKNNG